MEVLWVDFPRNRCGGAWRLGFPNVRCFDESCDVATPYRVDLPEQLLPSTSKREPIRRCQHEAGSYQPAYGRAELIDIRDCVIV